MILAWFSFVLWLSLIKITVLNLLVSPIFLRLVRRLYCWIVNLILDFRVRIESLCEFNVNVELCGFVEVVDWFPTEWNRFV